jgi:hypothetical protein
MPKSKKKSGNSIRGISRIDQPEKHNHGFYVRVTRNCKQFAKFFSDKKSGSKNKALIAAKAHYADLCLNNPAMSRRKFAQIQRRSSKTGIVGVSKIVKSIKGKSYKFWQATWSPKIGTVQKEAFSVKKFGEIKAKEMAVKARNKGVREMQD